MIKPNCSPSFLKRSSCPSTKQIQRSDFPNWKQINMEQIIYIYIYLLRDLIYLLRDLAFLNPESSLISENFCQAVVFTPDVGA
jgi:hypothetical protein